MWNYCAYALTIASDIEIPELQSIPPDAAVRPDIRIRLAPCPLARVEPSLRLECRMISGVADVIISDGHEILVYPCPGVDAVFLRALLVGKVMGLLLRQRGWLPLHASAVVLAGSGTPGAVLFAGESGAGKSTTAAGFLRFGHTVIADDIAAVAAVGSTCLVRPAWPRLRLGEESMQLLEGRNLPSRAHLDKQSVDVGPGHLRRLFPVSTIFMLEYGDRLGIEPVSALDAVMVLNHSSFPRQRRRVLESVQAHIDQSASVASVVSVFRLVRPRSLSELDSVVRLVVSEVGENA